mgnify:CR=1 FL=1
MTNSANAVVKAGLLGAGSSSIVAAVAVTNSDNKAQIKVNGTAEADKGSVKMDADATQSLNTAAAAQAGSRRGHGSRGYNHPQGGCLH